MFNNSDWILDLDKISIFYEKFIIMNIYNYRSNFSSEKTERPLKVQNFSRKFTTTYNCINQQGKMILYFLTLILICHVSNVSTMDIDLGNLPNNVLKFRYGINYKYMGKVSHSFDRFYIVTKFELPKVEDLKFDDIPYDAECAHLDNPKPGQIFGILKDIKHYCIKIAPHIEYYRKQIPYYNQTAADILTNELATDTSHIFYAIQTEERYYNISHNRFYRSSV